MIFAARNKQGRVKQGRRANKTKQPPKGEKGNVQILTGISPSPKKLHSAVPLQGWSLELSSSSLPPPLLNPRRLGMLGNFRYQSEVTLLMSIPWMFTSAAGVCRCLQQSTIVLSPLKKSKTMILTVLSAFFKVRKRCVEDIDHWWTRTSLTRVFIR